MPAAEQARAAVAAVAFLTRLPVGRLVVLGGGDVARGAAFFPLVGAGIGAAVGGTAAGLVHAIAFAAAGVHGLELAGIAVLSGVALGLLFFRWLGGTTGDLLGAAAELTETLALVAAAALTGSR